MTLLTPLEKGTKALFAKNLKEISSILESEVKMEIFW